VFLFSGELCIQEGFCVNEKRRRQKVLKRGIAEGKEEK
jgi:hypothetical protein